MKVILWNEDESKSSWGEIGRYLNETESLETVEADKVGRTPNRFVRDRKEVMLQEQYNHDR